MTEGWTNPEDRLLARSVFGTDDPETARGMILDWVAGQGFGRARVTAVELSVGAGMTVTLTDRSRIFVKAWPGPRTHARWPRRWRCRRQWPPAASQRRPC